MTEFIEHMRKLTVDEKKLIEDTWNIIRRLSPESVPVENSSEKLEKQKKFKEDLSKIKQCLDNIYDDCPYPDNSSVTRLLSNARYTINLLVTQL